jgi:hypothetical protein
MDDIKDEQIDRFAEFLGKLLDFETNFAVTEKQAEEYFKPKLAVLAANDEDIKKLNVRLSNLGKSLGAPPELFIYKNDKSEELGTYDTFPNSVLSEIISSFWKARRAISKSHLTFIAQQTLLTKPELISLKESDVRLYISPVIRRFWEQIEYAYIRLAAYWDRVGQLLDYVYFHIRQYENDGFTSVMEKIRTNIVPCYSVIENSKAFTNLRSFQKSEKEDGLVWLLRRRNLLIHRIGFSIPQHIEEDTGDEILFYTKYNHFEAVEEKLKQGNEQLELDWVHNHLIIICNLFPDVLDLAQEGAELIPRPKRNSLIS